MWKELTTPSCTMLFCMITFIIGSVIGFLSREVSYRVGITQGKILEKESSFIEEEK